MTATVPPDASDGTLVSAAAALSPLEPLRSATVTDQIYDAIYDKVIDLSLPPGTRLSEAEVAGQMGVSRQPVRDAFFRLSKIGLIHIRPQRATTVTPISVEAVQRAQFVRLALEIACVRQAAMTLDARDLAVLTALVEAQVSAMAEDRRDVFHQLDDRMHREICERAGLGFVWTLIKDNKAHMDRVRYLSLAMGAPSAIADHRALVDAFGTQDADAAEAVIRRHLGRIVEVIGRIRSDNPAAFNDAANPAV